METYDRIIIGAGIYGLYSALNCARKGQNVLVLECDSTVFNRASYINQARVHQGYHYPRSLSTAIKSAGYFERFNKDYGFCINREFKKIYATSEKYSWSDGEQFKRFCKAAHISCEEMRPEHFFRNEMCDSAFLTTEYTYDAMILKEFFLSQLSEYPHTHIECNTIINNISKLDSYYLLNLKDGRECRTVYLLNATYAGTNQIMDMLGYDKFKIKYELCEIILCDVNEKLMQYGLTVMDGPFFSIMPFGKTGKHSLTSVTFTPHTTSYDPLPVFQCQKKTNGYCTSHFLGNCNECIAKPETSFPYMSNLAHKYLKDELAFFYSSSLYSMKPILMSSEIDDSRPTLIKTYSKNPTFVSVLSGKVNTIYDLDEVLNDE